MDKDKADFALTMPGVAHWGRRARPRRVCLRGETVDLGEFGLGEVPLSKIRWVEFHRSGANEESVFRVQLATSLEPLELLQTTDRILARAIAERLARNLDRSLRDFTGRELMIRKPGELDRPLDLSGDLPGDPDPSWSLQLEEDSQGRLVSWPEPRRLPGVALALAGLVLVFLGWIPLGVLLLLGALAAAKIRGQLRVRGSLIEIGNTLASLSFKDVLEAEKLEQLELEVVRGPRLLLISDEKILLLERPRDQLEWMHRWLLEELRRARAPKLEEE